MSNDPSAAYIPDNNAPWPSPYRADTDPCPAPEPRLSRATILSLAPAITACFLADDLSFARRYRDLVRLFLDGETTTDLTIEFLPLLRSQLPSNSEEHRLMQVANEHDFANIHRAVWLTLYRSIVCVLNFNIHEDWGDPPGDSTSQGRYDYVPATLRVASSTTPRNMVHFHTTPNGYGSYAISTSDIPAPDLGIGESRLQEIEPIEGDALPPEQIRPIARDFGRKLVDPAAGDAYLGIVKSYYRDPCFSYTDLYAARIQAPSPARSDSPKTGADAQPVLGDNDVANVHRGVWLFLAHRFSYLVGRNPFRGYADVGGATRHVDLPTEGGPRRFQVPNRYGEFNVNLEHIDPSDDI
jgi:hypothetical protein